MSDRRVGLDVGAPGTQTPGTGTGSAGAGTGQQPDQRLADEFRARVAGEPPSQGQPGPAPVRPFDLFAAAAVPEPHQPAGGGERLRLIEETVARMLVSDASRGGPAEARVRVKDDLLPGTEVRVSEHAGQLQVAFVATDAESAAWLTAQAETVARELSRRLRKEVRVSVRREGDDADSAVAQGEAQQAPSTGLSDLFARRPIQERKDDEP